MGLTSNAAPSSNAVRAMRRRSRPKRPRIPSSTGSITFSATESPPTPAARADRPADRRCPASIARGGSIDARSMTLALLEFEAPAWRRRRAVDRRADPVETGADQAGQANDFALADLEGDRTEAGRGKVVDPRDGRPFRRAQP